MKLLKDKVQDNYLVKGANSLSISSESENVQEQQTESRNRAIGLIESLKANEGSIQAMNQLSKTLNKQKNSERRARLLLAGKREEAVECNQADLVESTSSNYEKPKANRRAPDGMSESGSFAVPQRNRAEHWDPCDDSSFTKVYGDLVLELSRIRAQRSPEERGSEVERVPEGFPATSAVLGSLLDNERASVQRRWEEAPVVFRDPRFHQASAANLHEDGWAQLRAE
eukprot:753676-Hanusia_phi.AAC.10